MEEYLNRRKKLLEKLPDNSIVISFSGNEIRQSADEGFKFTPDYSFFYLTGIKQASTILLMTKNSIMSDEYLFIQKFDALKEVWTGIRLKAQEAREIASLENVLFLEHFEKVLEKCIEELSINGNVNVYLDFETAVNLGDFETFISIADYKKQLEKYKTITVCDMSEILKRMRMVKSDYEISELRKAITNTNKGLKAVLNELEPNKYEYEMANLFKYTISKDNNAVLSFNTIAASGSNAIILHYPNPMGMMNNGDLLLLDLGSDHNFYKADISRTYPINGKYNDLQKKIYETVLECNELIIDYIKPGLTIADLQKKTREFFFDRLKEMGLVEKEEDLMKYYYHNISHHLGLDTHDISLRELPLEKGNVITVEPGLYIKEYGIGVRIEDDVLVTEDGSECLSKEIVKSVKDIENLMKR